LLDSLLQEIKMFSVSKALVRAPRLIRMSKSGGDGLNHFNGGGEAKFLCRSGTSYSTAAATESSASQSLLLSDPCVARLKSIGGENTYLRVTVEGGGCSGFQYKFELEDDVTPTEDDRIIQRDGAKVIIDETSLDYLKGSTLDYHKELIRAAFRIVNNPQADTGCSCGASFSVKLDL